MDGVPIAPHGPTSIPRRIASRLRRRLARQIEGAASRRTHDPSAAGPRRVLPAAMNERYAVPADLPIVHCDETWVAGEVLRHRSRFPVSWGDFPGIPARFTWYRPLLTPPPHPLVIVFPLLGGPYVATGALAAHLARRGFSCVMPHRLGPFLSPRTDSSTLERICRETVRRARWLLHWFRVEPSIDARRAGVLGISLGGFFGTGLLALEPGLRAGILALAGGDVPQVLLASREPKVLLYRAQRMQHEGLSREELRRDLAHHLVSDPLAAAPFVDASRILFVSAERDRVIPADCSEALWRAMGRPERLLLPRGHYSTFFAIHILRDVFGDFLEARLSRESRI